MKKTIARGQVVLRSMSPRGYLERPVVLRGVLRSFSFGLYRKTRHAAELDKRVAEALSSRFSAPYRAWLQRYQAETAPSPPSGAGVSVSVVLHPSGMSAFRLARCLRTLRHQDQPCAAVAVLAVAPGERLAARAAIWLAGGARATIHRSAADMAAQLRGDVLLLKGAPLLRRRALGVLAAAFAANPAAVAAYADEDRLGPAGVCLPFLKPDHSPILGQQYDYVGNVTLFRRDFFVRCVLPHLPQRGLPPWIGNAAHGPDAILHVPEILHAEPVRRRLTFVSGASYDRALAAAARRGSVPTVAIVIPTKNRADLLRDCIESILDNTNYERGKLSVIIVDNGSTEPAARRLLRQLGQNPAITVLSRPAPFNYAWLCNQGAAAAAADLLVFMNNDIVIRDKEWLAKLAGASALPSVGVVGCKLLYPSGRVQHAGVILGINGLAGHIGVGAREHDGIHCDLANHSRELSAVTGALSAIPADLFRRVGGYDERLAVAFNDIALCLACNELGRQTLCLQSALAYHLESASRGHDDLDANRRARLMAECLHVLSRHSGFKLDPFYNPAFSLTEAYALAEPPRHIRRDPTGEGEAPRVLMLSATFQVGHGVAVVVAALARLLEDEGCTVIVGAPRLANELAWPAEQRVAVSDAGAASRLAVELGADVVIAHTPLFYGVFRTLPTDIAGIAYDYGEPPPELFPDAVERRLVDGDKLISFHFADRLLAISDASA